MFENGALRVGRIGGIAIDIHVTFGLVVLLSAWWGGDPRGGGIGGPAGMLVGVLMVLLLFGCVLLHELAHGWQARAFGLTVRRIILLPIGGLTELETPVSSARQELLIALAGPLVNLALAGGFAAAIFLINPGELANSQVTDYLFPHGGADGFMTYLLGTNLLLFLFNIIPAFPMDGGRILRAGLALATSYLTGTRIAAWVGRLIGIGLFGFALIGWPPFTQFPNLALMIVSLVVFMGAQNEEMFVLRRWALARVNVGDVLGRPVETLSPWDNLSQGLLARLFRRDRVMPVVVEGRLVGLLTYREAQRYAGQSQSATVAHAMRTAFPSLQLRDTLWVALQQMLTVRLSALPVVEGCEFRGMITLDDVNSAWKFASRRS